MPIDRTVVLRRIAAFCVDWFVLALWGGLLFGVVTLLSEGDVPKPANAWLSQCISLAAMTMPFTLYFAITESSVACASIGKRVAGIRVVGETGLGLPFRRALLRNVLKFIPWELGHTVAHQAVYSGDQGLEAWVWIPLALSFAGPVWWIVDMLRTSRAPYDRWTGSRVVRSREAAVSSARSASDTTTR